MKRHIFSILCAVITAFTMSFAVVGCKKDEKVIKINEVTHSVFYTPLYLADALGYFKDEGYEIELTNGGGADSTMAAVLSGSADVGFCGPEASIYVTVGNSSDSPKVFGQLTKRDGSFLVGRVAEPDFSWSNLNGKEILAGRKGGVPAMTFEYTLTQKGIKSTLNYDVAFNMMTSAFESGIADYCTMFEPGASQYQSAGKGYIVASVGEASGEVPYTCFTAKQSFIDKNPQKIDAILRSVTKAIKYVNENSASLVAQKIAKYFDGTTVDALTTSIENYKKIDAWVTDMAMQESAFNRLQDIMENSGELERRVKFADVILTERAHAIYQEVYS
ncbi:MAG: ABC transporter substrate-binding protein [Candidatus Coproplasma sp.]